MWGCFLMSGVKILHFLKDWWKSIPIHQNYTMALTLYLPHFESQYLVHLQILIKIVQETLFFHTYMVWMTC